MLFDQISTDYVVAMKAKDSLKSGTLNFLRAQLKNVLIEQKGDKLEDMEVIAVIKKQVKQRQDSIEQFTQGGRKDLAQKEEDELTILKTYLPEELSQDALKEMVDAVIKDLGASSMKDMGNVMKIVIDKSQGQADNRTVSELVKKALS